MTRNIYSRSREQVYLRSVIALSEPASLPKSSHVGEPADSGQRTGAESIARDAAPVRQWLIAYFQRRIRNRDEVEDLVQEVFARIVSRNSSERIEHLGGYILKTAGSILADRARRRSTRHADAHIAFDPDQHGGADIDPERTLSDKEDLHVATAALLSLPERTRTIFVLRRLEGWRMNDIAAHLGISISAVEKHMLKAMRHLSAEMEKHRAS